MRLKLNMPNYNIDKMFPITKKMHLDECTIINSSTVVLKFIDKEFESHTILRIILRNVKTREEYACSFIRKGLNFLILNLDNLLDFFTNYETDITIISEYNNRLYQITPIYLLKEVKIKNNKNFKEQLTCFIRILTNGELRLSSVLNKRL